MIKDTELMSAQDELDSSIYNHESALLGIVRGEAKRRATHKTINIEQDSDTDFFSNYNEEIAELCGFNCDSTFEKGMEYIERAHLSIYKRIMYKAGYRLLLNGARYKGCVKCFMGIAHCLRLGIGTDKNVELAESLVSKYIEDVKALGDRKDFEADIALYYATVKELPLHFTPVSSSVQPTYDDYKILSRAINENYPHALYLSAKDQGGSQIALQLLEEASKGGFALATYTLGTVYHKGYTEQADWIWVAYPKVDTKPSGASVYRTPNTDDPMVIKFNSYSVGERYHRGLCHNGNGPTAKIDFNKAKEYYNLAIEQGFIFAPRDRLTELECLNSGFEIYDGVLYRYRGNRTDSKVARVPDCVKSVFAQAFMNHNLKKLIIPDSVTDFSIDAFGVVSFNQNTKVPRLVGGASIKSYKRQLMSARRKATARNLANEIFEYRAPITYLVIGLLVATIVGFALGSFDILSPQITLSSIIYALCFAVCFGMCIVQQAHCHSYQTVVQKLLCTTAGLFATLFLLDSITPPVLNLILVVASVFLTYLSVLHSGIFMFPWDTFKNMRVTSVFIICDALLGLSVAIAAGLIKLNTPRIILSVFFALCAVSVILSTVLRAIKQKKRSFNNWWGDKKHWEIIALIPLSIGFSFLALFNGLLSNSWIIICSFYCPIMAISFCVFMLCDYPSNFLKDKTILLSIVAVAISVLCLCYLISIFGFGFTTKISEIIVLTACIIGCPIVGIRNYKKLSETDSGYNAAGVYFCTIGFLASIYCLLLYTVLEWLGIVILGSTTCVLLVAMSWYKTFKKND